MSRARFQDPEDDVDVVVFCFTSSTPKQSEELQIEASHSVCLRKFTDTSELN